MAVVYQHFDHLFHIERFEGLCRDNVIQLRHNALGRVICLRLRGPLPITCGEEIQELPGLIYGILVVFSHDVSLSGLNRVRPPATELRKADIFAYLSLDEGRPGDAHEAGLTGLNEEVLHYGVICLPTQAGSQQQSYLRNHS
ncbi:MAG: hypothetical protein DDT26_01543 [Dehalococcoidia bacterium]|nr:hypothetical protein [Chloroflexota bacterium]